MNYKNVFIYVSSAFLTQSKLKYSELKERAYKQRYLNAVANI